MELVLSLMLLALVYALFKTKHAPPTAPDNPLKYMPYAAVRIEACDFSCNKAFELSSKMLLRGDAPELPLKSCESREKCTCRLVHYDDRRQYDGDRRSGSRVLQDTFQGDDRRNGIKRGRRLSDYQLT